MKLQTSFIIDGNIVNEVFKKGSQTVYQTEETSCDSSVTLYFVNNQTNEVQFKLFVDAECNQNFGFIGRVQFTGVK